MQVANISVLNGLPVTVSFGVTDCALFEDAAPIWAVEHWHVTHIGGRKCKSQSQAQWLYNRMDATKHENERAECAMLEALENEV